MDIILFFLICQAVFGNFVKNNFSWFSAFLSILGIEYAKRVIPMQFVIRAGQSLYGHEPAGVQHLGTRFVF